MLRGNANMWHKSALPATESHSVQPRSGLVASPDPCGVHEVLGNGCSPDASRAGMLTLCAKGSPPPGSQTWSATRLYPGVVASSMACDHGERTYGDRLRSPTLTWLTGPTKQLSRSARRYT